MIFPRGATSRTDHATAGNVVYDAVIVGAGVAGAIVANQLAAAGKRVLMLEAGRGDDITLEGYKSYLERFFGAAIKHNQSPYADNPNSPFPKSTDALPIQPGDIDDSTYLVQQGPFSTDTTYTRAFGGTTMHWEGKTLRMLPEDFETHTRFGQGRDWPIGYEDLTGYYNQAELELATSADVEDQAFFGIHFDDGYVYPMKGLPLSYLDQQVDAGIRGTTVELGGEDYELKVRPFPQARNGIPNPDYDGGKGYQPIGAVSTHQVEEGHRCQGNINCVPLCPVQAKYNAGKTLAVAFQTGRVDLLAQTVASKVIVDKASGQVTAIEYKSYADPNSAEHVTGTVRGKIFVLAGNAIENPRLMLASGLPSTSGLMGRNLMDHAYLLSWALMPQVCGTGRGSVCTGGIQELRGGNFRRDQAAFNCDIHNEGWGWATGSPYGDLAEFVDEKNRFGKELRTELVAKLTRQLLLAFMVEVMPEESNTVTVDPAYTDQLGNMRPFIRFQVPDYTMNGVAFGRRFARDVFSRLGAEDHTVYKDDDYGYVNHQGEGYVIRGGNHLGGTHIMGTNARDSVVDSYQRSWDHDNLYLAGGGSMPTIGSSNITLTLAALCYRTSEQILDRLRDDARPVEVRGA